MDYTAKSKKLIGSLNDDDFLTELANLEYRNLGLGFDISEIAASQAKRKADALDKLQNPKRSKRAKKEDDKEELSDEQKLKRPDVYKTCVSCRNARHLSQYPKEMPSSDCDHEKEICRMCTIAWIRSQIQDGKLPRCAVCFEATSHAYVEYITRKTWDREVLDR